MPNHVRSPRPFDARTTSFTTVCRVTGPEPDLVRFLAAHVVAVDASPARFSFHSVIPMPDVVRATESSSDSSLGYVALRGKVPPERLHQSSNVAVYLDGYDMLPRNVRDQASLRSWLTANRPGALALGQRVADALDETGFATWYDWACARWGTKWDAYSYETREREVGLAAFKFESAWAFPEPVFRKLAKLYPLLVFTVESFDEGWNFACVGAFNGPNDYRRVDATKELYERVYGEPPDADEDASDTAVPS